MILQQLCEDAIRLITGDREADYGHPKVNLKNIANIWSAHLGNNVMPKDVCLMMAELKIARLKNVSMPVRDQRDTVVDILGYILLLARLEE